MEITEKELEVQQLTQVIQDKEYAEAKSKKNAIYGVTVTRIHAENNPQNFCGNCKYCKYMEGQAYCQHPRVCIWSIDPDDASCEYFQSNQVDRDKPDHPCCKACNRDNCNGCTLCPF